MKLTRFLYPAVALIALIPVYQNCAKKASSYSLDTSLKTATLNDHLGSSGSVYEIVHDSGDGYGQVDPDDLYVNMEGGDSAKKEDDPASTDGNSIEPNQPDSNPKTPDTTTQNSDGSVVVPLDCAKADNLEKECVDDPKEVDPPQPKDNSTSASIKFDLQRWCRGRKDKGNILDSKFVAVKITSKDGKTVLCEQSGSELIAEAKSSKSFTLKNCDITKLPSDALITVYNDLNLSLYHGDDKESFAPFTGTASNKTVHSQNTKASAVKVSIANYKKYKFLPVLLKDNHKNSKKNKVAECDKYDGSPLVIDMRAYSLLNSPFYLSSPVNGKQFNILGDNGGNQKMRISWITDNRVMFVVLPNSSGAVNGINELFGDGTKGPDGFYADNGFKALAKYDAYKFSTKKATIAARDGVIDKNDEVFSKLRLWYDQNLDAVVDSGELITLSEAGVKSIDLEYDTRFHVKDQHGNHIKFKSAVEMNDGKLRPIFDIWFKLDDAVQ